MITREQREALVEALEKAALQDFCEWEGRGAIVTEEAIAAEEKYLATKKALLDAFDSADTEIAELRERLEEAEAAGKAITTGPPRLPKVAPFPTLATFVSQVAFADKPVDIAEGQRAVGVARLSRR